MLNFRAPFKIVLAGIITALFLFAQSGAGLLFWNAGTPIGSGVIVNCSTGLTCTNNGGLITMSAAGGGSTGPTGPSGATGPSGSTGPTGGGSGSGTVTVVGSGSLIATAIATGGGGTTLQTPSINATVDTAGNLNATSLTVGQGSGTTGILKLTGKTSGNTVSITVLDATNPALLTLPQVPGTLVYTASLGVAGHCKQYAADGIGDVDAGILCGGSGGGSSTTSGSITTLPASPITGQVYIPTDSVYSQLLFNGTWQYFYQGQQVTAPSGSYTVTNPGSSTFSQQTNGVQSFSFPNHGATTVSANVYTLTAPAVPFTSIYRFASAVDFGVGDSAAGIVLREGATGKLLTVSSHSFGTGGGCPANASCLLVESWSSPTGSVATLGTSAGFGTGVSFPWTVKVSVASGSTGAITLSYSVDGGVTFIQLYNAAKNAFFTTGPDGIGVMGDCDSTASGTVYLTLIGVN